MEGNKDNRNHFTGERIHDMDTAKPILPDLFLRRLDRKPTWIYMKYERLPNTCYRRGMLNHETRQCRTPVSDKERVYGGWLKAEDQSEFIPEWSGELSEMCRLIVDPTKVLAPQSAGKRAVEVSQSANHPTLPDSRNLVTLESDPKFNSHQE